MKYNPDIHRRRSIRLRDYDYSQAGLYFIAICTQNRMCLFGKIENGEMVANDAGTMINRQWQALSDRFHSIEMHEFIVMPNHIHGIAAINRRGDPCDRPDNPNERASGERASGERASGERASGEHKVRPYGTLPGTIGRMVQAFKSITTYEYIHRVKQSGWPPFPGKLWQRNYYEHVIRDETSYLKIADYIKTNPLKWTEDTYYD